MRRLTLAAAVLLVLPSGVAMGQAIPATNGAFSLFASWSEREYAGGEATDSTELIGTISLYSENDPDGGFEYGLDGRFATYPGSEGRDERVSLYDAWVGYRGPNDRWTLRAGQMWLHDLGGLGSVGGLFGEYRFDGSSSFGRWRFGAFGGKEPEILDAGYVDKVTKAGAYVAVDGDHGRRHVLGYVRTDNDSLTEREVVIFNNFIPVGREFLLYQALEYDTQGAAEVGDSELTYFFANLRYSPVTWFDIQGTYHRGRSIDSRSIAQDILDGRPVDPERLQGLLFESSRLRFTVRPWRTVRLWASYGQDRNNQGDDDWYDNAGMGFSVADILGIGLDLTAANTRIDRFEESFDSTYLSLGKTIGRSAYISLDYTTSLSVFHYDSGTGIIETRPESDRYALSANLNLSRAFTLLLVGEWLDHGDFEENRVLTGLTFRF